jgi:hypothetical protein
MFARGVVHLWSTDSARRRQWHGESSILKALEFFFDGRELDDLDAIVLWPVIMLFGRVLPHATRYHAAPLGGLLL